MKSRRIVVSLSKLRVVITAVRILSYVAVNYSSSLVDQGKETWVVMEGPGTISARGCKLPLFCNSSGLARLAPWPVLDADLSL